MQPADANHAPAPEPLLEIRGLRMHITTADGIVQAVDGVDLSIGTGEIVGLVGESGSGKSMTSRTVVGLLPPGGAVLEGQILFKGRDLLRLRDPEMRRIRGAEISFIFQNPSTFLNPVLRIGDQIAETVKLHQGVRRAKARQLAVEALRDVGLRSPEQLCEAYPHQLSGGMLQRVMIAMALSCEPALLIADECTTELDVTTQLQILELLRHAAEAKGCALLLITHNLGVVAHMCERVYVMYAGRVAEAAGVMEAFDTPRHPYTEGLLRATLSAEAAEASFASISGSVPDLVAPPHGCRFHPRCGKAMDRCRIEVPAARSVGAGQRVACFLYEGD